MYIKFYWCLLLLMIIYIISKGNKHQWNIMYNVNFLILQAFPFVSRLFTECHCWWPTRFLRSFLRAILAWRIWYFLTSSALPSAANWPPNQLRRVRGNSSAKNCEKKFFWFWKLTLSLTLFRLTHQLIVSS